MAHGLTSPETVSYEEQRRQRLEENKRKLAELRLGELSGSLRESVAVSSASKGRKRKPAAEQPGALVPLRRSDRVASLPEPPTYKEVRINLPARFAKRSHKTRDLTCRVYASDEERNYAFEKAQEVEAGLGSLYPTFVKPMLQSHVTGGFWLGLPSRFSSKYLPKNDARITLVDENDDEFDTVYLARKAGLSGGWRGFALHHNLVDGDAVVFQLTTPTTFKVYIVTARSYFNK